MTRDRLAIERELATILAQREDVPPFPMTRERFGGPITAAEVRIATERAAARFLPVTLEPRDCAHGSHRLHSSHQGRAIAGPDDVTGSWVRCIVCGTALPLMIRGTEP